MKFTKEQYQLHQKRHGFLPTPKPVQQEVAPEPSPSPAQNRWAAGEEKQLSALVVADLRRRGFVVVVSRTDKATTQDKGVPDLIVMRDGRVACIELKAGRNVLSQAQKDYHAELLRAGVPVATAWNFEDAVQFAVANVAKEFGDAQTERLREEA